ncbi:MAG: ribosome maturation factor [Williamsia sp.]|nr:ribosome maturation factor [Williamsia sp.]
MQTEQLSGMVNALLEGDPGDFLVDIRITPGNHIKVFIDNDKGITIDKCVAVNRALYKKIEESNLFPGGDFSLEVSSPGLDEPLKLHRQFVKNLGRFAEVTLHDGARVEGKLVSATDTGIEIEESKGKKKEPVNHTLLFENIKTTKIKVVF